MSNVSDGWLQAFLEEAVEQRLCTKIFCTTCGAMPFRQGVVAAWAAATGEAHHRPGNRGSAEAITRALAGVPVPATAPDAFEQACRCLVFDLCRARGEFAVAQILGDSWAGGVLRRMREHSRAVEAKRAEQLAQQDPEVVRQRREERKRAAEERHRQRLEAKKERDRAWWATHERPGDGANEE